MQGKTLLKYTFILLLIVTNSISGFCQLNFVSYTTKNNLSQSSVNIIKQDLQGFIWIGTDDGLNKFDGKDFQVFKNIPNNTNSISSNKINDLVLDNAGNLWIATDRGLNEYNPINQQITRYFLNPTQFQNDLNNYTKIQYDSIRHGFWLATLKPGFVFFDPIKDYFVEYNLKPRQPDNNFHATDFLIQGDILWITSSGGGLFKFNTQSKYLNQYTLDIAEKDDSIKINHFNKIFFNPYKSNFIIGTQNNGIYLFDAMLHKFTKLTYKKQEGTSEKDRIRDFCRQGNKIWIATKGGLTSVNLKSERFGKFYTHNEKNNYSLTTNSLLCLLLDKNNNLWIGSSNQGLNVYFPTRFKFPALLANEKFPQLSVLAIQKINALYTLISTDGEGMLLWQRKTNKLIQLNKLPSYKNLHNSILSITIDNDSIVWLGTWGGGLQKIDFKKRTIQTFLNDAPTGYKTIIAMYSEPGSNILWLGTFNGLLKFNKKIGTYDQNYQINGLFSNKIYTISGNNSDTLWIGTMDGGLSILKKSTGKAITYLNDMNDPTSLSSNMVYSILNQGNKLWIATSNGLNIFDMKTKKFKSFFSGDGLPNDNIYSVLQEGDSAYWVSTNKGLSRIVPHLKGNTYTNFDTNDGLQANEFNQGAYFIADDGEIFLGGVNGLNYFYPNKIIKNNIPPMIQFTSFKKFGQEVKMDTAITLKKEINLTFKENFLEFEFIALDYVFPSRNEYSFKMEGFDNSDWSVPSNRNYASFPNLVPGDYVFRVRGSNGDGVWNTKGISLHIIISPPFYKRKSVIAIEILLILIAIYSFFKIRIRMIEREKRILEQKVKERTIELQEKNDDITSSIQYAKRIQEAILPNINKFVELIPESFILYKPKDIVSGDFFWYFKQDNKIYFAAADCTGHGVPGAFMSIIGNSLMDNIIKGKKIVHPNEILNQLNIDIQIALNQQKEKINFDGMDIALCMLEDMKMEYAAAFRPLIIIKNGKLKEIKGERFSIGGAASLINKKFTNHVIELKSNDWLYLFSDGFVDQFGGKNKRKFMIKNFKELLLSINHLPPEAQKIQLEYSLKEWMDGEEQIDDILVTGLKIS